MICLQSSCDVCLGGVGKSVSDVSSEDFGVWIDTKGREPYWKTLFYW